MKQNTVERKIMWGDLDSLGIVFYPRYYEWIDACGHLFLESLHLSPGDLWRERNILFGLVETSCRYLKPGRYHQRIRITTYLETVESKFLVLKHIIRLAAGDELMVEGMERRICLDVSDPDQFRAIDIPRDVLDRLQAALSPK